MTPELSDHDVTAALARVEDCLGAERPLDAVADLRAILAARPNHPMALCGVGRVSIQLGDNASALSALDLAVNLAPHLLEARNARGVALQNLGRFAEAEAEFRHVAAALPDNPGARLNLASLLAATGEFAAAEKAFRDVLDAHPEDATAAYNLGLLRLLQGDLDAGWKGFEKRHSASNIGLAAVRSVQPRWCGEHRPDATLLITAEQGLGDNIQFVRYAPFVADRVGKVIVEAPPPLVDLFGQVAGIDGVVSSAGPLPEHDLHIPVMSLPAVFATARDTIPWDGAYIEAAADRVDQWRRRLSAMDGRRHVGLVWAGNPHHKRDRDRSMKLADLAPLFGVKNVQFHALQVGPAADQLEAFRAERRVRRVFQLERPLTEVAAVIASLDLLISVDTSLVHLAGAMGRPVWTLVTQIPDWRWMLDRADSPWYPSMRLFRQARPGDWGAVVAEVTAALEALPARTPD